MKIHYAVFIAFFLWCLPTVSDAKEIIVTDTATFIAALQTVEDGDTLVLEEGQYTGSFTIDRSIHLKGNGIVVIQGIEQGNVLTLQADQVTIENIHITGSGSSGAGIYITSNQNRIIDTKIYEVFHGIYVNNGFGNRMEGNTISSYLEPKKHKGYGVYLVDADYSHVSKNTFNSLQDGVYVSFSDYAEVIHNDIENARYGVHTMDSQQVVIHENEVRNSHIGAMIMQSYYVYIRNNHFHHNTTKNGTGIFVFDTFDSDFSQNQIDSNFRGIYFENASRNTIHMNQLMENMKGLELNEKSNYNRIFANNFIQNMQQVVTHPQNENAFTVDGIGNYWDDGKIVDLNDDKLNDFAYKSGDVFYALTAKEPYYQIFVDSPAVRLWNMIEQFTYIPTDSFIIDEQPLTEPMNIRFRMGSTTDDIVLTDTSKGSIAPFILFLTFSSVSVILLRITRRRVL